MARQALFDLMKAQEDYRAKNNKYTNELSQTYKSRLKIS